MGAFDLHFTRDVPVAPDLLWRGWTEPTLLTQWFTPTPWVTTDVSIDLVPGGGFSSTMQGPDGTTVSNAGCYLVVEPTRRLVWTSALHAGYVPAPSAHPGFHFTAELLLEGLEGGTRYTARAIHPDAETMAQHAAMGFEPGWNAALDQLVALMSSGA